MIIILIILVDHDHLLLLLHHLLLVIIFLSVLVFFVAGVRLVILVDGTFVACGVFVVFWLVPLVKDRLLHYVGVVVQNLDNFFNHMRWHRRRHDLLWLSINYNRVRQHRIWVVLLVSLMCHRVVFHWVARGQQVQVLRLAPAHLLVCNFSVPVGAAA